MENSNYTEKGICKAHSASVEDVIACPSDPNKFCSVSWDKTAILWDLNSLKEEQPKTEKKSKKRKVNSIDLPQLVNENNFETNYLLKFKKKKRNQFQFLKDIHNL